MALNVEVGDLGDLNLLDKGIDEQYSNIVAVRRTAESNRNARWF